MTPKPDPVSPADAPDELAVKIRRAIGSPKYRENSAALVALDALLAVGERDKAERDEWAKTALRRAEKIRELKAEGERVRERDRQHIAQLTEALNEMTDAGYEHVMGHDDPGDLASAVQKAARVLSPLSPEWFAAADEILTNLGAVLADKEDAEPERQVAEGYATGMRESRPNVCWRLLDGGDWCCILDRGHDGGIHEPGRAAGEGDT